jgi:hypothetical protein
MELLQAGVFFQWVTTIDFGKMRSGGFIEIVTKGQSGNAAIRSLGISPLCDLVSCVISVTLSLMRPVPAGGMLRLTGMSA